jgi:hypothetical protein
VAPVNQDSQLYAFGTPEVNDLIQRSPDGPAGEQNIVNQDDVLLFNMERDLGFFYQWHFRQAGKIIPVQGYVQDADRDDLMGYFFDLRCQAFGQEYSSGPDPDDHQVFCAMVLFDYFHG